MKWRKSSYSGNAGSCVEVASWRRSSHSNSKGNCIEVGRVKPGWTIGVRDSKNPGGPVLTFGFQEWQVFLLAIRGRTVVRHRGSRISGS